MSGSQQDQPSETVLQRVGSRLSEHVERWMPSPFIFAIVLTYIVFLAGVLVEGASPAQMVRYWFDGFWILLRFTMQAVLILATGFVIAYHPFVQKQFERLLSIPSTGSQAVVWVGLIAMVTAWFHWGLGLIIGALLAREMGRRAHERDMSLHYPLVCVAGFMGLAVTWNLGLSGAAILLMNTPGNFFIRRGIIDHLVPVTKTIFHPYTITLLVIAMAYTAIALWRLSPPESETEGIAAYLDEDELSESGTMSAGGATATESPDIETPADRFDNSRVLGGVIAITGVVWAIYTFATRGLNALNLNTVNFAMLFIGFALYTRPEAYKKQFSVAIDSTSDIILQFPFYAGIIGMATNSGLARTLTRLIVSLATPETYPAAVLLVSVVVNTFVPSGGGEWTVIGPIVIPAAQRLGVPIGQILVAYGFGSAFSDLVQPFWALPLLAITDMRARDIFGYAIMMFLLLLPFLTVLVVVVPYQHFAANAIPF